jgi:hypothetical protein
MEQEFKEILNGDNDVRKGAASNPNTPAEVLTELAKDSNWNVRCRAASNPSTPAEVLTELAKDSDCDVRRGAAFNPSTPAEVLTELAKDSDCDVRCRAASNPSTPGSVVKKEWHIANNYVATQGTTNLWYKFKSNNQPFYVCGCFTGNRDQLIGKITYDGSSQWNERMAILALLDEKFDEVFNVDKATTNHEKRS